jgi:TPR repeat protein
MHDEIKNYVDYMDTKHLLDSWTNDLNLEVKLSEQSKERLDKLVEYSKDPNKAILAKWYLLIDPNAVGPESIEMGYFRKFAELDNSLVQAAFARCYFEGNLVPRNLILALKWAILAEDEDDQRQYEAMFTPVAVHDKPYKRLPGSDTRPCENEIRALLQEMGGAHLIPLAEQLAADHKGN